MNFRKKHMLFILLISLYLVGLGLFRDHLFISINYQIAKLYYHDSFEWQLPDNMKFLEAFSGTQLYYGKWLLSLIFCLLYFIPVFFAVKKYFPEKIYLRLAVYAHLAVFCIGGLFYLLALLTSDMDQWYPFSRNFLGFLQSPMMLILLIPSFLLVRK